MTNRILQLALLLLLCYTLPAAAFAQKRKLIKELFYQLPVDQPGVVLLEHIERDSSFNTIEKANAKLSDINVGAYYKGSIRLTKSQANPLLEKATLSLERNTGYDVETKEDIKSSDINIIYLFTSETAADAYFAKTWDKISAISKDTSDAQFGFRTDQDFSYGKSTRLHQRKRLPEIYLMRKEDNKKYVYLIYRREGY